MLEYALAVFFLIVTPGPGVLSTAGVGSAFGARAGFAYVSGLFVGNFGGALAVVSGLAAAALAVPWLRIVLMWGSTAYLLYLAAKIAFRRRADRIHPPRAGAGLLERGGAAADQSEGLCGQHRAVLGLRLHAGAPGWEVAIKLVILNAIWIPIHLGWLWAGVTLRRLDLPARTIGS
jgi:threonine/homoserine/homoserine lactone efflux protein